MSEYREIGVDTMEEGSKKLLEIDGHRIALFYVDGNYYAVADSCTHAEASLSEGFLDGFEIECPMHGARFDIRTGKALALPAFQDVRTYDVRKDGDKVLILV